MAVNYMVRININMTIVAMVQQKSNSMKSHYAECHTAEIPEEPISRETLLFKSNNGTDSEMKKRIYSTVINEPQSIILENETLILNISEIESKRKPSEYLDKSFERKILRYLGVS